MLPRSATFCDVRGNCHRDDTKTSRWQEVHPSAAHALLHVTALEWTGEAWLEKCDYDLNYTAVLIDDRLRYCALTVFKLCAELRKCLLLEACCDIEQAQGT